MTNTYEKDTILTDYAFQLLTLILNACIKSAT